MRGYGVGSVRFTTLASPNFRTIGVQDAHYSPAIGVEHPISGARIQQSGTWITVLLVDEGTLIHGNARNPGTSSATYKILDQDRSSTEWSMAYTFGIHGARNYVGDHSIPTNDSSFRQPRTLTPTEAQAFAILTSESVKSSEADPTLRCPLLPGEGTNPRRRPSERMASVDRLSFAWFLWARGCGHLPSEMQQHKRDFCWCPPPQSRSHAEVSMLPLRSQDWVTLVWRPVARQHAGISSISYAGTTSASE